MHPLKIDSVEKEARIIVLVKDGEIGVRAKLKQATQAIPVSIGPLQVNLTRFSQKRRPNKADFVVDAQYLKFACFN